MATVNRPFNIKVQKQNPWTDEWEDIRFSVGNEVPKAEYILTVTEDKYTPWEIVNRHEGNRKERRRQFAEDRRQYRKKSREWWKC